MALSALVALLQYPCIALVRGALKGDPFYVSAPYGYPTVPGGGSSMVGWWSRCMDGWRSRCQVGWGSSPTWGWKHQTMRRWSPWSVAGWGSCCGGMEGLIYVHVGVLPYEGQEVLPCGSLEARCAVV